MTAAAGLVARLDPARPQHSFVLGAWYGSVARQLTDLRAAAGAIPPTGLVLASMLSVQVGAALAKGLFPTLGPAGTVFLRIGFGALVLLAVERPRLRGYTRRDYAAVALFGRVIAGMNTAFYNALARLPLGVAVPLEFVGPLAVAVFGSRRRLDLLWGGLAAAGVILLAPTGSSSIDPLGVAFALVAAAEWAAYILLNVRVGRAFPAGQGLAMAMAVAAVAVLPLGGREGGLLLAHSNLLPVGIAVAILSTVVPFSLEHAALKRLPARTFGVLMSLEPAVAATVGLGMLAEWPGIRGLLALVCVSIASAGSARFGRY